MEEDEGLEGLRHMVAAGDVTEEQGVGEVREDLEVAVRVFTALGAEAAEDTVAVGGHHRSHGDFGRRSEYFYFRQPWQLDVHVVGLA